MLIFINFSFTDLEALSHNMHKKFNIPTIIYTKEVTYYKF